MLSQVFLLLSRWKSMNAHQREGGGGYVFTNITRETTSQRFHTLRKFERQHMRTKSSRENTQIQRFGSKKDPRI